MFNFFHWCWESKLGPLPSMWLAVLCPKTSMCIFYIMFVVSLYYMYDWCYIKYKYKDKKMNLGKGYYVSGPSSCQEVGHGFRLISTIQTFCSGLFSILYYQDENYREHRDGSVGKGAYWASSETWIWYPECITLKEEKQIHMWPPHMCLGTLTNTHTL